MAPGEFDRMLLPYGREGGQLIALGLWCTASSIVFGKIRVAWEVYNGICCAWIERSSVVLSLKTWDEGVGTQFGYLLCSS